MRAVCSSIIACLLLLLPPQLVWGAAAAWTTALIHPASHRQGRQTGRCHLETGNGNGNSPGESPGSKRRVRYSGKYPRNFSEKYKEQRGDQVIIQRVLEKGMTPAGTHVPIMIDECLHHLDLDVDLGLQQGDASSPSKPLLVVDCTLGYGGHSSLILKALIQQAGGNPNSKLVAFDQDPLEIVKTDQRLRDVLQQELSMENTEDILTTVNQNFQTLGPYLESTGQSGHVTCLLADLGLSSMQIDDNQRGFTYKREGPLDMRMNNADLGQESALDLLSRLKPKEFQKMLEENSDEEYASEIAFGLLGGGNQKKAKIPETTVQLAEKVRDIVRPLLLSTKPKNQNNNKKVTEKQLLDSTVARVMQAIRIEVNGEFRALEQLLEDLPNVLAPGARAVFLTFHSGEDRRVKKAFKSGFNSGIYSSWSRDVVRPSAQERRNNPRSSCCKLRWAIRSSQE
jgi:16S rRNA (cytosine1402-N4)-methyltransferase